MSYKDLVGSSVAITLSAAKKFQGVIANAGDDFLALVEPTMGCIVIPLEHIKQLRTGQAEIDAGETGHQAEPNATPVERFDDALAALVNKVVQLEGGGPEATIGYLLEVREDYVILVMIPDGVVCFPKHHVHVILPLDVTVRPEFLEWLETEKAAVPAAGSMVEVMRNNLGKLIKVGRDQPDCFSGILHAVDEGFIELVVSPHESLWIPTHHIKSFCLPTLQP